MKRISRELYLNKLINRKENGMIKIVTGIRRSGKSYLLDPIFKEYLISNGVKENHIIIFSTHILELATDLCDEIVIFNNKKLKPITKTKSKIISALKEKNV